MQYPIYSVSQVNGYIKGLLDADPLLGQLFVRGEISNYKAYPSGHHYFSLKDPEGTIRCVMFRREAVNLRFRPQNGMKVIALGRVAGFSGGREDPAYVKVLNPDGGGGVHEGF